MVTDDPSSHENPDPREPPSSADAERPHRGREAFRGPEPAPQRIGPYEIDRVVTQDRVEVVCEGRDTLNGDRPVIVTAIWLVKRDDQAELDQLKTLAAAIGALSHPHLVGLLDFLQDPHRSDLVYCVSRKEPGRPLAELIAESSTGFELKRVTAWAEQLAGALDHLHQHHLHHGSINPSKVVIDASDRAYLRADTCIENKVRKLHAAGTDPIERLREAYARWRPPRERDEFARDLYALAATLYAALGGESAPAPGTGEGEPARVSSPKPIPRLSVQVNMALLETLSRDRATRPHRGADLVKVLQGVPPRPVSSRPPRPTPTAHLLINVTGGAVAVAALALGTWLWLGPTSTGPGAPPTPVAAEPPGTGMVRQRPLARLDPPPPPPPGDEVTTTNEQLSALAEQIARAKERASRLRFPQNPAIAQAVSIARRHLDLAATARAAGLAGKARLAYEAALEAYEGAIADDARAASVSDLGRIAQVQLSRIDQRPPPRETPQAGLLEMADAVAQLKRLNLSAQRSFDEGRLEQAARTWQTVKTNLDALARLESTAPPHTHQEPPAPAPEQRVTPNEPATLQEPGADPVAGADRASDPEPETRPEPHPSHGETLLNSLDQAFTFVAPGQFRMGSPETEASRARSEYPRMVRITRGFWIARTEVTRGQFAAFVDETGYRTDAERQGWAHSLQRDGRWQRVDGLTWRDPGFGQTNDHPVVCVSFIDARAFCRWLGRKEDRTYRLPTEAQWEFACRAGSGDAYHWGNDGDHAMALSNTADATWTNRYRGSTGFDWSDGYLFTSPVADFEANAWGLFDCHGNVQEWCQDRYGPYDPDDVVDPRGHGPADREDRSPRVLRGGSFAAGPASSRSAHRDASAPDSRFVTFGFRIVLEEDGPRSVGATMAR